jgi:cytochrome d ubiquinol oxidase subunit I
MNVSALLLSRIQFAFTLAFHIIFPAFTIGLAAWLTLLEALWLVTLRPVYRRLFDFWLSIFGVAFGIGVVTGIVMAFQFGTNWSELSRRAGSIQGPLLGYESFTAFALEAAFFGVLMFGRKRVLLHGRGWDEPLRVLDYGQQQLDAVAGRLHSQTGRRFHPH